MPTSSCTASALRFRFLPREERALLANGLSWRSSRIKDLVQRRDLLFLSRGVALLLPKLNLELLVLSVFAAERDAERIF